MNEKDLQIFIDSTIDYFSRIGGEKAEMGVPFLKKASEIIAQDYTGVIGISGNRKGMIYFTASGEMLAQLVDKILGIKDADASTIVDLVGEIANTIAGNARETFGTQFMISIPVIVEGQPKNIKIPTDIPVFVIPVRWHNFKSFLVIGIQ